MRAKDNVDFSRRNNTQSQFRMQNRRYLGNKFKLLQFIEEVVREKIPRFKVFCDIFAGTGVVGMRFNSNDVKIISNDILTSNYIPLRSFLAITKIDLEQIASKIDFLNNLRPSSSNYFSRHFGNTYFSSNNARRIGTIRETIEAISESEDEKAILITALLYATDRVANTVGHYDAYLCRLDMIRPLRLFIPGIQTEHNGGNEIYKEDANRLVRKISCDVLYVDPPYNSRQYSDTYHLLENLATWKKPVVVGKAKKMERSHLKSEYCLKFAPPGSTRRVPQLDN